MQSKRDVSVRERLAGQLGREGYLQGVEKEMGLKQGSYAPLNPIFPGNKGNEKVK